MIKSIKILIWIYYILLLVEGALRKWVFPGQADALLIIRDPVALLIYALAIASGQFPLNKWILAVGCLFFASILASFAAGQTNLLILAYGLRTNYFHLPLIWIMVAVLDRNDLKHLGTFTLLTVVPMAIIMVMQFRSPMDAWINRGVGGSEDGQIFGAEGKIRPPGLFAFITGPQLFLPFATAFFLHQITKRENRYLPWLFVVACGVLIAIALPVSISRTAVLSTGLVGVVFVAAQVLTTQSPGAILKPAFGLLAIFIALSALPVFKEGRDVFMSRWEFAAVEEDGDGWKNVKTRTLSGLLVSFEALPRAKAFGEGIGVGSNVGTRLRTGLIGFGLAEEEWSKIFLELGPVLGLSFILFRVALTIHLGISGLQSLIQTKDPLALLLFFGTGAAVFQFQWGPPTILGFAVFGAGCTLVAARETLVAAPQAEAVEVKPVNTEIPRSAHRPSAKLKPSVLDA